MARPPVSFSEEQRESIKVMAGIGIIHKNIAKVMGTTSKTLRKHCKHELDVGGTEATMEVAKSLYNLAVGGNVAACIFWMKARAGWTERHEVTGKGGKDLIPKLDLDDRVELGRRLAFTLAEAAHNLPDEEAEPEA